MRACGNPGGIHDYARWAGFSFLARLYQRVFGQHPPICRNIEVSADYFDLYQRMCFGTKL